MKKIILSAVALVLMTAACKKAEDKAVDGTATDTTAVVKDETPAEAAAPVDSATANKKMREYATPGDMQKQLAMDNGSWATENTMWMGPGAEPMKTTGTAENKMIFGGRYQQSTHKGNFGGMPFEGVATVGYDNTTKKMVSTWIDNMGTGIMYLSGDYDPATKTTTFKGMCTDPVAGKEMPMRETWTMVDDNTRKMEMFATADGKEYKCMEMTMKRK